jgi:PAS domain S-box-containing protein
MPARRTEPDLLSASGAAADQGVTFFALDAAGIIAACQGTLGFDTEVAVGQSIFAIYRDDAYSLEQVRRTLAGEAVTFSKRVRGAVVEVRLAPQRDNAGKVTGLIGVATDVTARTTAAEVLHTREEALLRSEARARALLEAAPDAIIVVDRDGCIMLANTQAELLFGYPRQALLSRPIEVLLPERTRTAHVERRARYQATPSTRLMGSGMELYGRRQDGSEFPVEVCLSPLRDGGQNLVIAVIRDLSTRKTMEEAQARLAAIVTCSSDAIIGINLDRTITSWNAGAERLYGYTAAEVIGRSIDDLLAVPGGRYEGLQIREALQRGEAVVNLETERQHRDGRVLEVSISVSPIKDTIGAVIGSACIHRDISGRKAMEAELRASEARFRRLVQAAPVGVCVLNERGVFEEVNERYATLLGFQPEELVGQHFLTVYPERLIAKANAAYRPLLVRHDKRMIEVALLRKDGRTCTTLGTRVALRGPEGRRRLAVFVVDIEERKRAEAALQASEERFRALSEHSSDLLCILDADGTICYASASHQTLLGYNPTDLVSRRGFDFMHPNDVERARATLATLIAEGGRQHAVTRLRHADGTYHTFEAIRNNQLDNPAVHGVVVNARDITVRLAAEAAQAQLAAIVAGSSDAIIGRTLDGTITSWNAGAERLYGYTAAEAIGRSTGDLLAVPGDPHEGPQIREVLQRGEVVVNLETERRHRDGRVLAVSISMSPIKDAGGVVIGVAGIHRDISARKAMEEGLRASEARFRGLVQAAPVGICILDEHGVFEEVNASYAALIGYQPEELVGRHFLMVYPEPQQAMAQAAFEELLATGTERSMSERVMLCKDGSTRTGLGTRLVLRSLEGKFRLVAFVVDIEDRKAAERAVEEARALAEAMDRVSFALAGTLEPDRLYQIILEQAMAVLPCDYASIFLYRDGWAWQIASLGEETLPPGTRLFPIGGRARPWLATDHSGAVYLQDTDLEPRWVHLASQVGERRIRSVIGVPLRIEGEAIGAFQIHSHTPQRYDARHLQMAEAFGARTIQALRNAHRYAEEQQRAREAEDFAQLQSDFLRAVSHELLSPITATQGLAELLRKHWSAFDEDHRNHTLEGIAAAARRQERLVHDILDVSRAEAEGFYCERSPFALRPVVEEATAEVQDRYQGQRVDLDGSDVAVAEGDAGRTQQILVNLLDNAAKYSPEGSPVTVSWSLDDEWVVVRVRDHGLGIPEAGREQLFTRFGRLAGSTARARHGGTGLGLYLSRMLARAMGGELDLENTGPHGSTFRLSLPGAPRT